MDLKLKIKDYFFKDYPNFTIDTYKISIACFLGMVVSYFIGEVFYSFMDFNGALDYLSVFYGLSYAVLFTPMVYFVALAIEDNMFESKNPKKILDKLLIVSVVCFVAEYVLVFLSSYDYISTIPYALFAFIIVFLFGQILSILIENGVRFNENFPQKVTLFVVISFFLAFAFKGFQHFTWKMTMDSGSFIWLADALDPLFTSLCLVIPVLLMGYSLAIYAENRNVQTAPKLRRVSFDDEFTMELPEYNASLPNYGFEVQKPIDENFGQIKQWFGGNVSMKYFSFKNEEIKNGIMEDLKNIPNRERLNHDKYIIQKDSAENIYNVFYFKDTYALNLFGNDLDLLISLMDTVEFSKAKKDVVQAVESKPVAPVVESQPAASSAVASSSNGIVPLKEKGLGLPPSPVCDVCNKSLDVDKSWFVPNRVFYASQKYRKWNRDHFPFSETDAEFNFRMNMMESNDPTEGSAVCEDCIDLFR